MQRLRVLAYPESIFVTPADTHHPRVPPAALPTLHLLCLHFAGTVGTARGPPQHPSNIERTWEGGAFDCFYRNPRVRHLNDFFEFFPHLADYTFLLFHVTQDPDEEEAE